MRGPVGPRRSGAADSPRLGCGRQAALGRTNGDRRAEAGAGGARSRGGQAREGRSRGPREVDRRPLLGRWPAGRGARDGTPRSRPIGARWHSSTALPRQAEPGQGRVVRPAARTLHGRTSREASKLTTYHARPLVTRDGHGCTPASAGRGKGRRSLRELESPRRPRFPLSLRRTEAAWLASGTRTYPRPASSPGGTAMVDGSLACGHNDHI